ncbi:DUF4240 domain-containing protein, partial [Virgisporangium aliadipatigenens]|uniref:DUF4240 domain-containing protein n=1 Tax=Virgisporangium aliadipatigenens TaxID=741659 RepID=UPI0019443488
AEAVAQGVTARLVELGPSAAVEFERVFDAVNGEAYRTDLWAAAYLMLGGCSDDVFDYFRGWLLAQGRAVWESAVAAPDSLADLGVDPDDDEIQCEDFLSVASDAYAAVTGDEEAFWTAVHDNGARPESGTNDPAGEDFDFDDEDQMRARLPRLAAIYLDD